MDDVIVTDANGEGGDVELRKKQRSQEKYTK